MITVSNYNQEVSNVNWSKLPAEVKSTKSDVENIMQFYNDDKDIKEAVDDFLKLINEAYQKEKTIREVKRDAKYFKLYAPKHQQDVVTSNELIDVVERLDKELKEIPKLYASEKSDLPLKEQIVHAHYFYAGTDIFILESDGKELMFSYAILNQDYEMSEAGYQSIKELVNNGKIELDFYWTKTTLAKALYAVDKKAFPLEEIEKPKAKKTEKKEAKPKASNKKATSKPKVKTTTKKVKAKVNAETVSNYDAEYKLIRRFNNFIKSKIPITFRKIQLLYMAFQKAIVSRQVRKTSSEADLLAEVNKKVVKLFKAVEEGERDADVSLGDDALQTKITKFVGSQKVNYAVTLLRSYIGMNNTTPDKPKVQRLITRMENAIKKGRVDKENRLYKQVQEAVKDLKAYVKDNDEIDVKAYGLSGAKKKRKTLNILDKMKNKSGLKGSCSCSEKKKDSQDLTEPKPEDFEIIDDYDFDDDSYDDSIEDETPKKEVIKHTAKSVSRKTKRHGKVTNAQQLGNNQGEFWDIGGETGKFLQRVEKKPFHSVAITLDGHQGAGKTTMLYQMVNDFSKSGSTLFASLEQHPQSVLSQDKINKYISDPSLVDMVGDFDDAKEFYNIVKDYDFIFIDSWQKLINMIGRISFDEDLRKKFDGKVFVVVFQQTTTGRTKGGADIVFDGDIIIKIVKAKSFQDNYAYFDKNRYTQIAVENIKYNIANARCDIEGEDKNSNHPQQSVETFVVQ